MEIDDELRKIFLMGTRGRIKEQRTYLLVGFTITMSDEQAAIYHRAEQGWHRTLRKNNEIWFSRNIR